MPKRLPATAAVANVSAQTPEGQTKRAGLYTVRGDNTERRYEEIEEKISLAWFLDCSTRGDSVIRSSGLLS